MNKKECINVTFNEGPGIFDAHYGYPVIDIQEIHNGPTGKVKDIQGPQAHAGRDFFFPEGKEFSFDIYECPNLHIAIKAEKGTKTCLFLMVHDKEPGDRNRFVVIGKTPEGDPGIYDVITDCFMIEDDGNWHEHDFDLRNVREKDEEYPYFPRAGSISIIQFYSWTGSGEHTFYFNDLVCKPVTTTSKPFAVKGQVAYADGKPYAGGIVRAYDCDLRRKEPLGETTTNPQGGYEIRYSPEQFRHAEKGSADLQVCVVDEKGNKLVSSDVLFNAPAEAVIDLILPPEPERLSEYELLVNAITPLLKGQGEGGDDLPLTELNEKDIDFLAKDSGEPWERIAFLVAAVKASQETTPSSCPVYASHVSNSNQPSIPAEAFYGWFRQNLPTSLAELLKQNTDVLRRALETSLRDNLIPAVLGDVIVTILASLRQVAAESLLKSGESDGRASLGDLLSTIMSDSEKQRKIANLFVSNQGTTEAFWEALQKTSDFDKGEIGQIKTTLQLGTLTSNHLPLVRELQRIRKADPELNELRGFAKLELVDWVDIITRLQENRQPIGIPPDITGDDEAAKITNYAANLNRYIEKTFPTAVIAHRLDKNELDGSPLKAFKEDFKTFFANNPAFEFGAIPVHLYLNKDGDKKLNGVKQPRELTLQLKSMQRVFKITSRFEQINTLLADELNSNQAIVRMGPRAFVERHSKTFGGDEDALTAYKQAEHIHLMSLILYAKHSVTFNSPMPYVIGGDPTEKAKAHSLTSSNNIKRTTLSGVNG